MSHLWPFLFYKFWCCKKENSWKWCRSYWLPFVSRIFLDVLSLSLRSKNLESYLFWGHHYWRWQSRWNTWSCQRSSKNLWIRKNRFSPQREKVGLRYSLHSWNQACFGKLCDNYGCWSFPSCKKFYIFYIHCVANV